MGSSDKPPETSRSLVTCGDGADTTRRHVHSTYYIARHGRRWGWDTLRTLLHIAPQPSSSTVSVHGHIIVRGKDRLITFPSQLSSKLSTVYSLQLIACDTPGTLWSPWVTAPPCACFFGTTATTKIRESTLRHTAVAAASHGGQYLLDCRRSPSFSAGPKTRTPPGPRTKTATAWREDEGDEPRWTVRYRRA